MQKYKRKEVIQQAFNNMDNNAWEKKEQAKFEKNLNKLGLSIEQLNQYGYQLTLLMLIKFESSKPITTIQEAQIVGCSQALVAMLHHKLSVAKLLKIISNPKCRKTCRAMRYVIRALWVKLGQMKNLNIRNLSELIRLISLYVLSKKKKNEPCDTGGLVNICDLDEYNGEPIIDI